MRLLFIGDVAGEAGCAAVRAIVPQLGRELALDAVVANGESVLAGAGSRRIPALSCYRWSTS